MLDRYSSTRFQGRFKLKVELYVYFIAIFAKDTEKTFWSSMRVSNPPERSTFLNLNVKDLNRPLLTAWCFLVMNFWLAKAHGDKMWSVSFHSWCRNRSPASRNNFNALQLASKLLYRSFCLDRFVSNRWYQERQICVILGGHLREQLFRWKAQVWYILSQKK